MNNKELAARVAVGVITMVIGSYVIGKMKARGLL